MGSIKAKDAANTWQPTLPWVRTASGWARVKVGWRKTSSTTWAQFAVYDTTPPQSPVVLIPTFENGKARLVITAPGSVDVNMIRVKVSKRASTNVDIDADYISTPDGTDDAWSDWKVTPNQTRQKLWPVTGTLTVGAQYYITAWSRDSNRNFSAPTTVGFKYVVPATSPTKAKTAYLLPTDSSTFRRVSNDWIRTDKYVRVGGPHDYMGLWFFSNKFAAQLANAKTLTKVRVTVQRVNSWDYEGEAQFKIFGHTYSGWTTSDVDSSGRRVVNGSNTYSLARGQSQTITVPPSWYPDILSGKIKGIGIFGQIGTGSNASDAWSGTYHGVGTNSGRVYMEYSE